MSSEKRKYELRKRAESMQQTRDRITAAAMELHTSVGPSRTTISAVAERAGVQRHTIYRHFATDADLFAACSAHFYSGFPFPEPAGGLDAVYAYYERTGEGWATILRDAHLVEAVERVDGPVSRVRRRGGASARGRRRAAGAGRRAARGRLPDLALAERHRPRRRRRAHDGDAGSSKASRPGSSSTVTPSRSAFSSLDPGEAPATT